MSWNPGIIIIIIIIIIAIVVVISTVVVSSSTTKSPDTIQKLGTCEASRFDSNSNRPFRFDSKVMGRFENFESAVPVHCSSQSNDSNH